MKKEDLISDISFLALVVVLVIVIYLLILKIIGRSPSYLDIVSALVVGLIIHTFIVETRIGRLEGKFYEFNKSIKNSFDNIKGDIKEIKDSLRGITK